MNPNRSLIICSGQVMQIVVLSEITSMQGLCLRQDHTFVIAWYSVEDEFQFHNSLNPKDKKFS